MWFAGLSGAVATTAQWRPVTYEAQSAKPRKATWTTDIDWDLWLGPAAWAPYNAARCSGSFSTAGNSWRSYMDYLGGGMTDWGAHHFGGATFAVDVRELQPEEFSYHDEKEGKYLSLRYPNGIVITHNRPNSGSGTRQAFRWVYDWYKCFESLDGFRYQKASVCRVLVAINEK